MWLDTAARMAPAPGESTCGDRVASLLDATPGSAGSGWLVVVDGLGHGPLAAQAADLALACIHQAVADRRCAGDPLALLDLIDQALRPSRGAAVGLAWWSGDGRLSHTGLGNTRFLCWRRVHGESQVQRLPSRYGIVGDGRLAQDDTPAAHAVQHLVVQPGDCLLLFTDGLDEQLRLDAVPPASAGQPAALADHLLARHRVPRDDAGVLVCLVRA